MNSQPGAPGRSPFEDAALSSSGNADMAFSTDELSHPEYVNDDFRMFTFKVMKCPKRYVHDWRSCPFAHPTENARRRDPREVKYMPVPCPDYKRGLCLMGDACTYSHGVYECWLHPAKYRTQLCKDGGQCRRPVCFFAHSVPELRSPTYTWDGTEGTLPDGKQPSMGLPEGALSQARSGPGESEPTNGPDGPSVGYPSAAGKHNHPGYQYQQPPRGAMRQGSFQGQLDSEQAAFYSYPPPPQSLFPNQAMDNYMGMPVHPGAQQQHSGQATPFQNAGAPRFYTGQGPQHKGSMELPMQGSMGTMPGLQGFHQPQQPRLSAMQRFHSQQLPPQQPQHMQRQQSGVTPAGSLTSPTGPSSRPSMASGDLGELFNPGSSGNTAPRMSNAMARSLGLVPPKETRTRTLGALAGLMQAPRPTAPGESLQRPQLSYSLPAQLPDPDQHMREVYLAAQAAAAEHSNKPNQVTAQRQSSLGLPQNVIRPGSVGNMQRQPSAGVPQTPSMTTQRQGSMGLPQGLGQGNLRVPQGLQDIPQDLQGMQYNTNPQDVQAWQLGVQQGMKSLQALQQQLTTNPEDSVRNLQLVLDGKSNMVLQQLQQLGQDGASMKPGQLQGLAALLSKPGLGNMWQMPLSSQTIPEAEQITGGSENHQLAALLQSLQTLNLQQTDNSSQVSNQGQQHTASPFAAAEYAPAAEVFDSNEAARSAGPRRWGSNAQHSLSGAISLGSGSSAPSAPEESLPPSGLSTHSPFASPNQQLNKASPAPSLNSQNFPRHTSSPGLPSPTGN